MGSSSSKASRAVGAAARRYPSRPAPSSQAPGSAASQSAPLPQGKPPGPTVHPEPQASASRSEAINLDASDPDFARSLRSLGAVQPNPTFSPTSTFSNTGATPQRPQAPDPRQNSAITTLEARARLQDEAEKESVEAGRVGHAGRQFLDVYTIRQMLVLRDERGHSAGQIEKALGLRKGAVERLGRPGVAGLVQEVGRAQKSIEMV